MLQKKLSLTGGLDSHKINLNYKLLQRRVFKDVALAKLPLTYVG